MVMEIDRNPGAYPDGNVAEVCLWSCDGEETRSLISVSVAQSANTNTTDGWFHVTQNR